MKKYDLSILIPARNEMFLSKTVKDILVNKRGETEIIVGLDGQWADPSLEQHEDLKVVYYPESIGQRGMTNQLARLSNAKYLIKVDAHCTFDEGFDVKLMNEMQDNWTMVPIMKNLHAFDWVCKNGHRRYQGPSGQCQICGQPTERDIIWTPKKSPNSTSYCFDVTPHFQYFNQYTKRPEYKEAGDITETMSLQGSFFMVTREKYWELNLCDEKFGSWGSQGIEVAVKTWLSGGRVVCNHKTWYAHLFRTQGGDFSFPYPMSGRQQENAKRLAKDLFFNNKWEGQKLPFSWLLQKFWPIPGWTQEDLDSLIAIEKASNSSFPKITIGASLVSEPVTAGAIAKKKVEKKHIKSVVYYTDNDLDPKLLEKCQKQILKGIKEKHIVSVSLQPLEFGKNIVLPAKRGYLTMARQILQGVVAAEGDVVYFCEHDVLYHPSHFEFVPPEKDKFYYNTNVWRVRMEDGHGIKTDDCRQLSGLCANRELLLGHYRKRVAILEQASESLDEKEFNRLIREIGFEPGTHNRAARIDDYKSEKWESKYPNLDIKHGKNLTPARWNKDQFRNQRYTEGWLEAESVEPWGDLKKLLS